MMTLNLFPFQGDLWPGEQEEIAGNKSVKIYAQSMGLVLGQELPHTSGC